MSKGHILFRIDPIIYKTKSMSYRMYCLIIFKVNLTLIEDFLARREIVALFVSSLFYVYSRAIPHRRSIIQQHPTVTKSSLTYTTLSNPIRP